MHAAVPPSAEASLQTSLSLQKYLALIVEKSLSDQDPCEHLSAALLLDVARELSHVHVACCDLFKEGGRLPPQLLHLLGCRPRRADRELPRGVVHHFLAVIEKLMLRHRAQMRI